MHNNKNISQYTRVVHRTNLLRTRVWAYVLKMIKQADQVSGLSLINISGIRVVQAKCGVYI